MKKIILTAKMLMVGMSSLMAQDYITKDRDVVDIPNYGFRLAILSESDANNDGVIQLTEAQSVTKISTRSIVYRAGENEMLDQSSRSLYGNVFQGIEHLTNLEELSYSGLGASMRNVDLSKNPKLKKVKLFDFNRLENLKISNSPNLQELEISQKFKGNVENGGETLLPFSIENCPNLRKLTLKNLILKTNFSLDLSNTSINELIIDDVINLNCIKIRENQDHLILNNYNFNTDYCVDDTPVYQIRKTHKEEKTVKFAHADFRREVYLRFDNNGDGLIQRSEANGAKMLSLRLGGRTGSGSEPSVKGLNLLSTESTGEYFDGMRNLHNLESFTFRTQGIVKSNIDFKNNGKLKKVRIFNLSAKKIEFNQNENLEELAIEYTDISELYTSDFPNLKTLVLKGNKFDEGEYPGEFSIESNTKLEYVNLTNNGITCLNVDTSQKEFMKDQQNVILDDTTNIVTGWNCESSTEDEKVNISPLKTFPNPFSDKLNVSFDTKLTNSNTLIKDILLLDQYGQVKKAYRNLNRDKVSGYFNTNSFPLGVYFVKIITTDNSYISKMVKK